MTTTELAIREQFAPVKAEAVEIWSSEMQGAQVEFLTVTTPTAGGTTWEVEGESPTKTLEGVVVDDFEAHALYLKDYSGESNAPDAYWIAGECQYITDAARTLGYNESSHLNRSEKISNRQVLYLARPGEIVPIRVDLSGASCRPWRSFKQQQIVSKVKRVTDAAVSLALESVKYKSGYSGSLIAPTLLGFLDDEQGQAFYQQRLQIQPYTRKRTAPADTSSSDAPPVSTQTTHALDTATRSAAVENLQATFDASPVADDDIPFMWEGYRAERALRFHN